VTARPKHFDQLSRERSIAPFLPYSSHISPTTIITRDGDLMRTWKLAGIAHETADPADIELRKEQLNTLWRSITSSQVSIWTHNIRRQTSDRLESAFDNTFARELDRKYYDSFAGYKMMANELYVTIIYRPVDSAVGRALTKAAHRSIEQVKADLNNALVKLDEIGNQLEASLTKYEPDVLGTYDYVPPATLEIPHPSPIPCSTALEFLNFLLTGSWQRVRLPAGPLYDYLGSAWVFVGAETIEIRTPASTRYAQGVDFKDYISQTEPGLLNVLMYSDFEYILTQSFSAFSKADGRSYLDRQRKQLENADDGAKTQVADMATAVNDLEDGQFTMGEYHFSLLIYGNSVEETRRNLGWAFAAIQDRGFIASLIAIATDAAFYAQLPANWKYRPRVAGLTSKNFAGLASLHNFSAGKRDGNPWGQALTLFKTPSGQPYYFNLHYSKKDEDVYGKKPLGNTRVIGQSGAGKTVLLNMILMQMQKYRATSEKGLTTVFFDKDRGAELAIRAMGGKYHAVKTGEPTGCNPFMMEPTEANILELERIMKVCGRDPLTDGMSISDETRLTQAVRTVMRMPLKLRQDGMTLLLQNMTESGSAADRENSLAKRLARWARNDGTGRRGPHWWVFDGGADLIDFTTHHDYGFDGTKFLDNPDIRTPLSMYLLHRMDSVIDGRRFAYLMDEAWKWVDDDAFAEFAGDKQLTIRKQNGLGIFATQMPSSLLKSRIAAQLVQQVATEIYLPNPKADRDEYINGFKVTEAEYEIICNLGEESRMFLVKQGHHSALVRLDLAGFDDELAILSGSTDDIELLDELIPQLGEAPDLWLPEFHRRRKERSSFKRAPAATKE